MYGKNVEGTIALEQSFPYRGFFASFEQARCGLPHLKNGDLIIIPAEQTLKDKRDGKLPDLDTYCYLDETNDFIKIDTMPQETPLETNDNLNDRLNEELEIPFCEARGILGMKKKKGLYVNYEKKAIIYERSL